MGRLSNILNTQRSASDDDVNQIRSRARRRLIGAAVLLAVGVIGFPLLFETQPRPGPADVPVVIARKDAAADPAAVAKVADKTTVAAPVDSSRVASRAAPSSPPMLIESAIEAERESAGKANNQTVNNAGDAKSQPVSASNAATRAAGGVAAAAATAAVTAVKPVVVDKPSASTAVKPSSTPTPKPSATPTVKPPSTPVAKPAMPAVKSAPVATAKPVVAAAGANVKLPTAPAPTPGSRFVVQVGAFAQDAGVRDVRSKLDRVGLKSYTQNIRVNGSPRTRVRAGPFNSRDEAERAAEKAKSVGLSPSVVPLE